MSKYSSVSMSSAVLRSQQAGAGSLLNKALSPAGALSRRDCSVSNKINKPISYRKSACLSIKLSNPHMRITIAISFSSPSDHECVCSQIRTGIFASTPMSLATCKESNIYLELRLTVKYSSQFAPKLSRDNVHLHLFISINKKKHFC